MKFSKKFGLLVLGIGFSSMCFGATDGTLGATSTGTTVISLTVNPSAQITGLTNITLAPIFAGTASAPAIGITTACVFATGTTASNKYDVTVTGSGAANAFTIASGVNILPYTAKWQAGAGTSVDLTTGTPVTNLQGSASQNCSGTPNATFTINIGTADLNAAVPSVTPYTGTATILITPA